MNKKLRKFFMLFSAVVMSAFFISCGDDDEDATTPPADDKVAGVTITLDAPTEGDSRHIPCQCDVDR